MMGSSVEDLRGEKFYTLTNLLTSWKILWLQSSKITWASKNIMRDRFIRNANDEQLVRRRLYPQRLLLQD